MSAREGDFDFDQEKTRFLRFAETLKKADSALELRALLLADLSAPYHQHNLLDLADEIEGIGAGLCLLISEDLDEHGVPR